MERGEVRGFGEGSENFFTMVWSHTVEGMFSDPAYGGNRNAVGWKLIGFPGAQYGYSGEEMRYGADLSGKRILTLVDIQRVARQYIKPDRLSIVLVGNAKGFVSQLRAVGFTDFEIIPIEQLDLMSATLKKEPPRRAAVTPDGSLRP